MKALKIVCSGYIVRYPLGGLCWHHFQYLIGLHRLGHKVTFLNITVGTTPAMTLRKTS